MLRFVLLCLVQQAGRHLLSWDTPFTKRLSNLPRKPANRSRKSGRVFTSIRISRGVLRYRQISHRICPPVLSFTAFCKSVCRLLGSSNLKGGRHMCRRFGKYLTTRVSTVVTFHTATTNSESCEVWIVTEKWGEDFDRNRRADCALILFCL